MIEGTEQFRNFSSSKYGEFQNVRLTPSREVLENSLVGTTPIVNKIQINEQGGIEMYGTTITVNKGDDKKFQQEFIDLAAKWGVDLEVKLEYHRNQDTNRLEFAIQSQGTINIKGE